MLIVGYSVFEGVGSALMIPPIYILATLAFSDVESRARAFGAISGMGGIGAAAGPLIGGLITTTISWRASFLLQARRRRDHRLPQHEARGPVEPDPHRRFDTVGAVLSAAGMSLLVIGILQAGNNNTLLVIFVVLGAAFLLSFFLHIRADERAHKEPLLSTSLFRNRISNLGLVTQNIQWLLLMGITFTVSVFLQTERGFSAIKTGVIFTAATAGSWCRRCARATRQAARAEDPDPRGLHRDDRRRGTSTRLRQPSSHIWAFVPGLLVIGLGLGVMLTPSVNVVQSAFPEAEAGRDLRPLAQRLQPRLVARHGDRRDDPRRRPRHQNKSYILAMGASPPSPWSASRRRSCSQAPPSRCPTLLPRSRAQTHSALRPSAPSLRLGYTSMRDPMTTVRSRGSPK